MPDPSIRLERAEFNRLVDALLHGTTTVEAEAQRDRHLHMRRGVHHETLLHFFAVESKPEFVRAFAALGADLDTENEFGNTPLIESVIKADLSMTALLLELGADPNWQSSRDRNTALHVAAEYGRHDAARLLASAGTNPMLENEYSETAAELLAKHCLEP